MGNLELSAVILSCMTVICYLASGVLLLLGREKPGMALAVVGWVANLGIFIQNWYLNGYPPFASMYQVLSVLALVFPVILLILTLVRREQAWMAPYFLIGAAVPMLGTLFMDRQMHWSLVPALHSVWFVPHVFSYMVSYALCAIAFLLSIVALVQKKRRKTVGEGIYAVLRLAFPFMVFGLLLGAVWADQVWGNYWQWDLKEVWALITCMLYLCYFHSRRTAGLSKFNYVFTTLGFVSLVITFVCVNLLPAIPGSLHIYTL